jgi:N-methylhydantoinase A
MPKIESGASSANSARKGTRSVYQYEQSRRVDYTIYDRGLLLGGDRIDGPAIIEEPSSTTVIHSGDVLTVGQYGELVIDTV